MSFEESIDKLWDKHRSSFSCSGEHYFEYMSKEAFSEAVREKINGMNGHQFKAFLKWQDEREQLQERIKELEIDLDLARHTDF